MSYDPNAPVIQNAHAFWSDGSGATNPGALVGVVRLLRLSITKTSAAPDNWFVKVADGSISPRTIFYILAENIPIGEVTVIDFEGAIMTPTNGNTFGVSVSGSGVLNATMLYTLD